jgi:ribulose-5-phosphate 4-epimerase/fuculose-1-phosphate aldolase
VAHRWAARWGWHEGVINHFTALVPDCADRFFAIPYGLHWDEVKARDFLVVDLEGRVVEGEGEIELSSLLIDGAMHRDLRAPYISGRCDACCGARSRTLLVRADQ